MPGSIRRLIRWRCCAASVFLADVRRFQSALRKINRTARLEAHLKLCLSGEIAIGLSTYFATNIVRSEDRLFDFDIAQANERHAERAHRIAGHPIIEDDAMRGQVDLAIFCALE